MSVAITLILCVGNGYAAFVRYPSRISLVNAFNCGALAAIAADLWRAA